MRIAFLTTVFVGEYGVTRVLANQLAYLQKCGNEVDLFACNLDKKLVPNGVNAIRIPTHFKCFGRAMKAGCYDIVIACTDPFYKIIANLNLETATIAYEHGYVPVELVDSSKKKEHQQMIESRENEIYPNFTAVITISEFALKFIRWPKAHVLYNGGDHFANLLKANEFSNKNFYQNFDKKRKIRLLMVSRFRTEEWLYKGIDNLCKLKKDLGENYEISIVGGGDDCTYKKLNDAKINACAAISNPVEMAKMYYDCDAVISFSKFENFNLPLVEAGFAHKVGLALNVCAHPEVTPFVFNSYNEILDYLRNATLESLSSDGEKMFRFVDTQFRSENNCKHLVELLNKICPKPTEKCPRFSFRFYLLFWKIRDFIRMNMYKKIMGK